MALYTLSCFTAFRQDSEKMSLYLSIIIGMTETKIIDTVAITNCFLAREKSSLVSRTGKVRYLFAFIAGGLAMAGLAFLLFKDRLFDHVMVRVNVWKNPWEDIPQIFFQYQHSHMNTCKSSCNNHLLKIPEAILEQD
mgnify:CR=1 FL=1